MEEFQGNQLFWDETGSNQLIQRDMNKIYKRAWYNRQALFTYFPGRSEKEKNTKIRKNIGLKNYLNEILTVLLATCEKLDKWDGRRCLSQ